MSQLIDNHGRTINYVRLAVTDRCNLRCFYCMPEEGIDYVARQELMTYEEMVSLVKLFAKLGITKLRITGGEPFLRRDMMEFLRMVSSIAGIEEVHITTNGTLTYELIPELKKLGIASINLSLDSLDRERFEKITRRDDLEVVMKTYRRLIEYQIPTKINMVVMHGRNTEDLLVMAELARHDPVSVRFIEEMPFNGSDEYKFTWDHRRIAAHLQEAYPDIQKLPMKPAATAQYWQIPGFQGRLGIIAAYTRTFCGTCNRLRITPTGMLRTCLYDQGVFNIKDLMRQGADEVQIRTALMDAIGSRAKDGHEAEARRFAFPGESMSTIGG